MSAAVKQLYFSLSLFVSCCMQWLLEMNRKSGSVAYFVQQHQHNYLYVILRNIGMK